MEITRNEAAVRMFNYDMIELFVNDIEYGKALANFDSRDQDPYFTKSIEEKAKEMTELVYKATKWALESKVKEVLENHAKKEQ